MKSYTGSLPRNEQKSQRGFSVYQVNKWPSIIVIISTLYIVIFNYAPDNVRIPIAGLIGVSLLLTPFLSRRRNKIVHISRIAVALMLLSSFIVYIVHQNTTSYSVVEYVGGQIRMMTALMAVVYFASCPRAVKPSLLVKCYGAILLYSLGMTALYGTHVVAGIVRPFPFTGGEDGIHSSAYALTAALVGIITLWRSGYIRLHTTVLFSVPTLIMIASFQVRTSWTMLALFCWSTAFSWLKQKLDRGGATLFGLSSIIFLSIVAISLFQTPLTSPEMVEFSSGRTSVYAERWEILFERPLHQLLLGTGPGSEIMETDTWWWDAKNSHNDFIDVLFQSGVVGLASVICVFIVVARRVSHLQFPVLIAFVASSAISNGLLGRPLIAVLYVAILAVPQIAVSQLHPKPRNSKHGAATSGMTSSKAEARNATR